MNTDNIDIDAEFAALKTRRAKLLRLQQLRKEVGELELSALATAMIPQDSAAVMRVVCEEVCRAFNLDMERLHRRSREDHIATPRQVVFYLGHELSDISSAGMGRIFHKDHGTVLHGCKKIRDRIETDHKFRELVGQLLTACQTRLNPEPPQQ